MVEPPDKVRCQCQRTKKHALGDDLEQGTEREDGVMTAFAGRTHDIPVRWLHAQTEGREGIRNQIHK